MTEAGRTGAESLEAAARTVQAADELGYRRAWFAEHHGSPFAASVVPAVLIAHLAARTRRIRLGSGGVLAPNHAPIGLAEQFVTLATLHPGRIDMGIGRGPGTHDQSLVRALRRGGEPATDAEYQADVAALLDYVSGAAGVQLMAGRPGEVEVPAPWLLASSPAGAELAARLGVPIALAHHIRPDNTVAVARRYRELFTPSRWADRPYVMVAVETIIGETEAEAAYLGGPLNVAKKGLFAGQGEFALSSPEDAAKQEIPEELRGMIEAHGAAQARGTAETVGRRLTEIAESTGADELMLLSGIYDADARIRCLELAAKAVGPA